MCLLTIKSQAKVGGGKGKCSSPSPGLPHDFKLNDLSNTLCSLVHNRNLFYVLNLVVIQ
jgi:hypothetical protein